MFSSFKIWPILFLVILPLCYSFSFYTLPKITNFDNPILLVIPIVAMGASLEYVVKPATHNANTFFNKHGLDRTIHDYNFLQILLVILIILTITFNFITRMWFMTNLDWNNYFLSPEYYLNSLTTGLDIMTLNTSARFATAFLKRKTKYHLAKVCFQLCNEKTDEPKRVKFLQSAVNFYNQFIKRASNIQIQNTGTIYSKFISYNKTEKKTVLKSIIKSFEKESTLDPFKQLKKSFSITDESITESKLINDLKRWTPTAIGFAIAIIGIILDTNKTIEIIKKFGLG